MIIEILLFMFLMVFIALRPVVGIERSSVYWINDQQNGFLHVWSKAEMFQHKHWPGLVGMYMHRLIISICKVKVWALMACKSSSGFQNYAFMNSEGNRNKWECGVGRRAEWLAMPIAKAGNQVRYLRLKRVLTPRCSTFVSRHMLTLTDTYLIIKRIVIIVLVDLWFLVFNLTQDGVIWERGFNWGIACIRLTPE